jgi:hypothetical protein
VNLVLYLNGVLVSEAPMAGALIDRALGALEFIARRATGGRQGAGRALGPDLRPADGRRGAAA